MKSFYTKFDEVLDRYGKDAVEDLFDTLLNKEDDKKYELAVFLDDELGIPWEVCLTL